MREYPTLTDAMPRCCRKTVKSGEGMFSSCLFVLFRFRRTTARPKGTDLEVLRRLAVAGPVVLAALLDHLREQGAVDLIRVEYDVRNVLEQVGERR